MEEAGEMEGSCNAHEMCVDTEGSIGNNSSSHIPSEKKNGRKRQRKEYARIYYRRNHPFVPIFKNDIRRYLGVMWVNVINANDPFATKSFLREFSSTRCVHKHLSTPLHLLDLFPTMKSAAPSDQAILHAAYSSITTPDTCCKLQGCQIVQSRDERGSRVCVRTSLFGTKLFEVGTPQEGLVVQLQDSLAEASGLPNCCLSEALIPSLPGVDMGSLTTLRVALDPPLALEAENIFVIKLDEDSSIVSMEVHWLAFSATAIRP